MGSLEHSYEHENRNDKGNGNSNSNGSSSFEFPKGGGDRVFHHRPVLGSLSKPAPSKWDDAQKWVVSSLSKRGGVHGYVKNKPKASHGPRKISFPSLHGKTSSSKASDALFIQSSTPATVNEVGLNQDEGETKKIDYDKSSQWNDKPMADPGSEDMSYIPPASSVRSVCMRDMGTEMTPIASQEPSRTGTPIRATTPSIRSPVTSRPSTPGRSGIENHPSSLTSHYELSDKQMHEKTRREIIALGAQLGKPNILAWASKEEEEQDASKSLKTNDMEQVKMNVLEARAVAWEGAEQAKYMARYKREEVKIQAWENNQKIKAEAEMRRTELKVERMKSHAHERLLQKLEKMEHKAEKKHAAAEAKVAKQAVKTAQRADFIRQTGHLPSSLFSYKSFSCKFSTFCHDCYQ